MQKIKQEEEEQRLKFMAMQGEIGPINVENVINESN